MRFGIMAMQIKSLIPSNLPSDDLVSYIAGFDISNLVHDLASFGFDPVELGGDLAMFLPQTFNSEAIAHLAKLKNDLNISYTLHLPLWSVEPSTPLNPVRQGSVKAIIEAIQSTKILEPEVYVMHATGALAAEFYRMHLPELARTIILRQFQNGARESILQILAETGIECRKLAIETIEFPFDLTLELAEELNLSMCLDTGHVLVGFSGPIDLFDALERCLPRLAEIHLHDAPWQGLECNIGYGQDHRQLGTGDLDIVRLLNRLQTARYAGPIIFELTVEEAVSSMELIQSLRPDLVKDNPIS